MQENKPDNDVTGVRRHQKPYREFQTKTYWNNCCSEAERIPNEHTLQGTAREEDHSNLEPKNTYSFVIVTKMLELHIYEVGTKLQGFQKKKTRYLRSHRTSLDQYVTVWAGVGHQPSLQSSSLLPHSSLFIYDSEPCPESFILTIRSQWTSLHEVQTTMEEPAGERQARGLVCSVSDG